MRRLIFSSAPKENEKSSRADLVILSQPGIKKQEREFEMGFLWVSWMVVVRNERCGEEEE